MAAKREQILWPNLWDLSKDLEDTYSLKGIMSAGLLIFSRLTADQREEMVKAAKNYLPDQKADKLISSAGTRSSKKKQSPVFLPPKTG